MLVISGWFRYRLCLSRLQIGVNMSYKRTCTDIQNLQFDLEIVQIQQL